MEIGEYAQFFCEADIDSLMVYCKDHWGVTYYDSAVSGAQKHAGVRGDWIRAVRDQTARMGIEFVAYYCIEYDEGAARRFPEWRARQADGSPLIRADRYARWSLMCYQTGYREYALSQLAEIVHNYHPDALFLDIFGASLCYCPACREKFKAQFCYDLPETDNGLAAGRADITAFLDGNAREFYLELRSRLKAIDPSLAITINFSCHYPKSIRDLLDYQYSEPLMKDNWFSSAYAFDTASEQSPMLAPGEASQVYNYDNPDKYRCDLSFIAAQGCRVGMRQIKNLAAPILDKFSKRKGPVSLEKLQKIKNPQILAFSFFLIPGIPNGIMPYIFSRTSITLTEYLIANVAGSLPSTFICTFCGDRLSRGNYGLAIGVAAAAIVIAVILIIFKDRLIDKIEQRVGPAKEKQPDEAEPKEDS